MDFTLRTYRILLKTLIYQGFSFLSFEESLSGRQTRSMVLRHDVDLLPLNSLEFAQIQADMGTRGSYYFRMVPESYDLKIIEEIAKLGHEIGYHYEDLGATAQRHKGAKGRRGDEENRRRGDEIEKELVDIAILRFSENLEKLRKIVSVKTICMHGSPMSKWDSRLLWKYYDYKDFGIIGEPYFDIDFDEVLYLTDTGRRWDGDAVSVRDKVSGIRHQASGENPYKDWKVKPIKYRDKTTPGLPLTRDRLSQEGNTLTDLAPRTQHPATFPKFHSTSDIIKAAEKKQLPDKIMMTFHPQRWTDKPVPWVKELVWQNLKNAGKYFLIKIR